MHSSRAGTTYRVYVDSAPQFVSNAAIISPVGAGLADRSGCGRSTHAAEGPIFALGMIEEFSRNGYRVSSGSLYPLLHRMEKVGYLRLRGPNGKSLPQDLSGDSAPEEGPRGGLSVWEPAHFSIVIRS